MPIARPQDVVDEINKLYPFDDGPAVFPLDESTVNNVRRILKLANRIPVELLPKGSEGQLFEHALAVISNSLQKAAVQHSTVTLLQCMPEHGGENPICTLRRLLRWCPNLRPKELRRRLLELATESQNAVVTNAFSDLTAAAYLKNVPIGVIRRHMKILKDEGLVELDEPMDGPLWSMIVKPSGWKALEEPIEPTDANEGLIFISCGQFTAEERSLGQTLADAVNELTPYEGYFAQNESSLEGLSRNIFGALNGCVGFVAVMHRRGSVQTPQGEWTRASVWIEQEIAIAAFLAQAQGRTLPVALYIQDGISLEGVRQQLILNPIPFSDNPEVLADFRDRVKTLFPSPATYVR